MKKDFTPSRVLARGFFGVILAGTLLLMLPISWAPGITTSWLDALFTATSSVCVTGLVTVPTFSNWSVFGQAVILVLIQVGGLGFITFMAMALILTKQKLKIKDRILIQNAYNLDNMRGLVRLVKRIVLGVAVVEGAGAILYMIDFIPRYGLSGIWKAIFVSISAFCNAGMDILGPDSLIPFNNNILVNVVTMILITLGGLGFPVWWEIINQIKMRRAKAHKKEAVINRVPLFVKMVLFMSALLTFGGALVILLLEYNNPDTFGNMPLWQKVMNALLQSVTLRTAGFCGVDQAMLRHPTVLFCCVCMFIGGSPSGTAGGIKTTTIMILYATVVSIMKERYDTEIYKRKIGSAVVRSALAIFIVSGTVLLLSLFSLITVQQGVLVDCLFEAVSAIGTVGLSRGLTPALVPMGKLIIIATMYLGRIGPITLALFFNTRKTHNKVTYPEEPVSVG